MLSMTDSPLLMFAAMMTVGGVTVLVTALYLRTHPEANQ